MDAFPSTRTFQRSGRSACRPFRSRLTRLRFAELPGCARSSAVDEPAKPLTARFEVAELVEARAGRAEQHDLAGRGGGARPRPPPARACRIDAAARRRPPRASAGAPRRSDRRRGRAPRPRRAAARKSSPLPRPPRIRWTLAGANERSATSVDRDVGRLRVVDVEHAAARGRPPRAGARRPGTCASASATAAPGTPRAERHGRGGHRVLEVVGAAQAHVGGPRSAARPRHHSHPPSPRRSAPGALAERSAGAALPGTAGPSAGTPRGRRGPGARTARASPPCTLAMSPWRSRWSGARLSSTAASGANAARPRAGTRTPRRRSRSRIERPVAVRRRGREPAEREPDVAGDDDRPPAARWIAPISSTVVVLPLVPVTAISSLGSRRQASSSSPITVIPRARAAAISGPRRGTPGLLTTQRPVERGIARRDQLDPGGRQLAPRAGRRRSTPITRSPRAASASAAAVPERASPTTRYGPPGSGGRVT